MCNMLIPITFFIYDDYIQSEIGSGDRITVVTYSISCKCEVCFIVDDVIFIFSCMLNTLWLDSIN